MDQQFYQQHGLNIETYDAFLDGAKQIEVDLHFFDEIVQKQGGPILELGSGTGRVAWEMAKKGHRVTGLDLSESMIRYATRKGEIFSEQVRNKVHFFRGDMCNFSLDEKFEVALIPFRAFQSILTPEDQQKSLQCIRKHLKQGGALVIDLFDPLLDLCLPGKQQGTPVETTIHPVTGNTVKREVTERVNDTFSQTLSETWVFTEIDSEGKVLRQETETLALRWTYRWEMKYLLELSGFSIEAQYSDFSKSPPAYGNEQIWVACNS